MVDSVDKLHDISLRLEQIESAGEWIARTLVHTDSGACQAGTLVSVLAEDVRQRLLDLVTELEKAVVIAGR